VFYFKIQIIEEVLFNSDDKTKVTLLFANTSLDDILLKKELDKFAQKYPDRLKVYYTVDKLADKKETDSWKGEVGSVNI
jgi:cytochrome-b5 reductase